MPINFLVGVVLACETAMNGRRMPGFVVEFLGHRQSRVFAG